VNGTTKADAGSNTFFPWWPEPASRAEAEGGIRIKSDSYSSNTTLQIAIKGLDIIDLPPHSHECVTDHPMHKSIQSHSRSQKDNPRTFID
jgi:hypothetical protein